MVVAMALCLAACGGAGSKNAKITSAWSIVEMTVNGKSMTYDDSNRDAKAPQFSCTDGTNFTFTNNGKAHTGTLEKSGEKYILHYSDSNKTMEATISGKQMTIVISGSDSMRLVFETK
jgi:lipopolysaccharide export system protein LptA